jgi:dihydrofolate reductase
VSINIIAAIGLGNELGYKNGLLCELPEDMKRFKRLTSNHFVVMGSNTFHSIGHHLPNRQNIVLTTKTNHKLPNDVFVYNSVLDVLHEYENYGNKEVELWIIGGQSIYEQFLPHADKIYLTIIDHVFDNADTFFPRFSLMDFKVVESIPNKADEKHPYDYHYVTYERRIKQK